MEQRISLKFLVKLGKCPTECLKHLQNAYGKYEMSRPSLRVAQTHKEVEDDPKSEWPSSTKIAENIDKVKQPVWSDHRLTVQMIVEEPSLNRESVRTILAQKLGMWKVCAKMVPKLLLINQKENRVNVCQDLLEKIRDDPEFLGHLCSMFVPPPVA